MSDKYVPTIGLEIHAELKTKTKMFCNSLNDPDETEPNVNVCPVCMGHPGTLPVINKEAVRNILKVGYAIGGEIADYTEFDRKNYFYPDIPKGYQISQYKYPLISGGKIAGVELTRIHLEEDTAISLHDQGDYSLVNFNRAGVPLMELVTEPVIKDAEQAGSFARELQLLLRYLDISEANMEKGEMRVEVNISIAKKDSKEFGTKVEVKNLNSFRAAEKAIEYEMKRQIGLLENGEKVIQETRGWDENGQKTFSQRKKETSDDYRYFPDPDLPKLVLSELAKEDSDFAPENIKKEIGELPWEKRERLSKLGLSKDQVEFFVSNFTFADIFEEIVDELNEDLLKVKIAANYLTSDLVALAREVVGIFENVTPKNLVELVHMISANEISSRGAKDILAIMSEEGGSPKEIAEKNNLLQQSDSGAIEEIAKQIIAENESVVNDYKNGKESALQYLIGQGMKATKGTANPAMLKDIFKKLL